MYKKFIQTMENNLVGKLEQYGWIYNKHKKYFIGYFKEFVFRISFELAGYGTRIEIHIEYDFPIINDEVVIFPDDNYYMKYGYTINNSNWNIENTTELDLENYIDEMYFLFENHSYYVLSSKVSNYNYEKYIKDKYDELFDDYLEDRDEEDPAWEYQIDFLSSGKSQDAWTDKDSQIASQLTKEKQDKEFPYEKIKKQIIKTMEHNKPIYQKKLKEFFRDAQPIKIDSEVYTTTLDDVFQNSKIRDRLSSYGFSQKYDVNINGRIQHGETYYFYNHNVELQVILKDKLFLEFILRNEENTKVTRINMYDGNYFFFGWLIGKKSTQKENINNALHMLEKDLSN